MPAFLRDPHVEIDWRYSGDDSNAEAIFNIKYVFTLLLYGEMEPILRVCAHPGNHLKFWFTGSYFEGVGFSFPFPDQNFDYPTPTHLKN